jgi:hypothetical protein
MGCAKEAPKLKKKYVKCSFKKRFASLFFNLKYRKTAKRSDQFFQSALHLSSIIILLIKTVRGAAEGIK